MNTIDQLDSVYAYGTNRDIGSITLMDMIHRVKRPIFCLLLCYIGLLVAAVGLLFY